MLLGVHKMQLIWRLAEHFTFARRVVNLSQTKYFICYEKGIFGRIQSVLLCMCF
jgi:hypothetical protein